MLQLGKISGPLWTEKEGTKTRNGQKKYPGPGKTAMAREVIWGLRNFHHKQTKEKTISSNTSIPTHKTHNYTSANALVQTHFDSQSAPSISWGPLNSARTFVRTPKCALFQTRTLAPAGVLDRVRGCILIHQRTQVPRGTSAHAQ